MEGEILNGHHINVFAVSFGCVSVIVLQRCIKCSVNGAQNDTWKVIWEEAALWFLLVFLVWRRRHRAHSTGFLVEGKQFLYRFITDPKGSNSLRLPDFKTAAHLSGKNISSTHRPPLPQEIFLVLNSIRGW